MIPFFASLHIHHAADPASHRSRNRNFRLWIPLFLAWLILLPLVLILFPLVLIACLLMQISALRLYATVWQILSSLRHTLVEVQSEQTTLHLRIV
jgi:hypothetical protein